MAESDRSAQQREPHREIDDLFGATRAPSKRRALIAAGIGLCVLAGVIAVVLRLSDAQKYVQLIEQARPAFLLVAAALQLGTYVAAGSIWWIVLRRAGEPLPLRELSLLGVAKLFTDQALPAGGIAGTLVLLRAIVRRGTALGIAMAAFVVNLLGYYTAFSGAASLSLLFMALHHHANWVLVTMTGLLIGLALIVPGTLLFLVNRKRSRLPRVRFLRPLLEAFARAQHERIYDPVALSGSFALQLGTMLLDAATLWATLGAFGQAVPFSAAFASLIFAMIAEVVGFSPGGLGTFEATCVALLHMFGVPLEAALAGTLLLRGFSFWLPMLPGLWLLQRELRHEGLSH